MWTSRDDNTTSVLKQLVKDAFVLLSVGILPQMEALTGIPSLFTSVLPRNNDTSDNDRP